MVTSDFDKDVLEVREATPDEIYQRVLDYQDELIGFFTGSSMEAGKYAELRNDLLNNPAYGGLAPKFLRRCRDTGSLWSFAKSVDGSWEPRRQFVREQFEPLLELLEGGQSSSSTRMPGNYDATAWTGIQDPAQRVRALRSTIPVAQAAIECLIQHLEAPRHNGGPPLDEVETALANLRQLHTSLGQLLAVVDDGMLVSELGEGLVLEVARFARRSAKALRQDPLPYALSGTVVALLTACGFPGLGGYLAGITMAMRKPDR